MRPPARSASLLALASAALTAAITVPKFTALKELPVDFNDLQTLGAKTVDAKDPRFATDLDIVESIADKDAERLLGLTLCASCGRCLHSKTLVTNLVCGHSFHLLCGFGKGGRCPRCGARPERDNAAVFMDPEPGFVLKEALMIFEQKHLLPNSPLHDNLGFMIERVFGFINNVDKVMLDIVGALDGCQADGVLDRIVQRKENKQGIPFPFCELAAKEQQSMTNQFMTSIEDQLIYDVFLEYGGPAAHLKSMRGVSRTYRKSISIAQSRLLLLLHADIWREKVQLLFEIFGPEVRVPPMPKVGDRDFDPEWAAREFTILDWAEILLDWEENRKGWPEEHLDELGKLEVPAWIARELEFREWALNSGAAAEGLLPGNPKTLVSSCSPLDIPEKLAKWLRSIAQTVRHNMTIMLLRTEPEDLEARWTPLLTLVDWILYDIYTLVVMDEASSVVNYRKHYKMLYQFLDKPVRNVSLKKLEKFKRLE